jgi:hypothetical protein
MHTHSAEFVPRWAMVLTSEDSTNGMDIDSYINAEVTNLMNESGDSDGDGVSDNLLIALKFVGKCAEFLEDRLAGCQLAFPADNQVMHCLCEFETCP